MPILSLGQGQFGLNSALEKEMSIVLNGDTIVIDSSFTKIESNYPIFDTLIFLNNVDVVQPKVLCNFQPDSLYSLHYACCGSIDIIPSWKIDFITKNEIWYDDNRYQDLMMDLPSFTLRVVNNFEKDSIYGWYVDHACFPSFKLLIDNDWEYGIPLKCYYWNNISEFDFFTSNQDYSSHIDDDTGVVEDWFPYPNDDEKTVIEKVGTIRVRLFDNDSYLLIYDVQTSTVHLEIDDD